MISVAIGLAFAIAGVPGFVQAQSPKTDFTTWISGAGAPEFMTAVAQQVRSVPPPKVAPSIARTIDFSETPPKAIRVPPGWVPKNRKNELDRIMTALPSILYNTGLHDMLRAKKVNAMMLILAQIRVESELDPEAVSGAGATGFMQLMPDTYSLVFTRYRQHFDPNMDLNELTKNNLWPNLTAGVLYMRWMVEIFWSKPGCVDKALKAYNAGPNKILKKRRLSRETINYAPKIRAYYRQLAQYNAHPAPSPKPYAETVRHVYNYDQCALPRASCKRAKRR